MALIGGMPFIDVNFTHDEWMVLWLAMMGSAMIGICLKLSPVRRLFGKPFIATARLTKCDVTSSRKRIRVRINYVYTLGGKSFEASAHIIRSSRGYREDHREVAKAVVRGLTEEPFLELAGRSREHFEKHSVLSGIRRKVPELKHACFGF